MTATKNPSAKKPSKPKAKVGASTKIAAASKNKKKATTSVKKSATKKAASQKPKPAAKKTTQAAGKQKKRERKKKGNDNNDEVKESKNDNNKKENEEEFVNLPEDEVLRGQQVYGVVQCFAPKLCAGCKGEITPSEIKSSPELMLLSYAREVTPMKHLVSVGTRARHHIKCIFPSLVTEINEWVAKIKKENPREHIIRDYKLIKSFMDSLLDRTTKNDEEARKKEAEKKNEEKKKAAEKYEQELEEKEKARQKAKEEKKKKKEEEEKKKQEIAKKEENTKEN